MVELKNDKNDKNNGSLVEKTLGMLKYNYFEPKPKIFNFRG